MIPNLPWYVWLLLYLFCVVMILVFLAGARDDRERPS